MADNELALSAQDFSRVRALVLALAGISLADSKGSLVVSRLAKRVRATEAASIGDYLDRLEARGGAEEQAFVNALTTNLTRFFREPHHFDRLVAHVAALARGEEVGRRRLRIWSAGCSSGQEPYSAALALLQGVPAVGGWDFRILATDIDTDMIARGVAGTYPLAEIDDLPAARRWGFERVGADGVRIAEAARRIVTFRPLNLMADWPMSGPFDAIFCRNVAIYFDRPTQQLLFQRLAALLAPGGLLFLGHSETLGAGQHGLTLIGETTYRKAVETRRHAA